MNERPKSTGQVRAIFGLAKQRGLDNEELHALVAEVLQGNGSDGGRVTPLRSGAVPRAARGNRAIGQRLPAAISSVSGSEACASARAHETVSIAALTYAEAERVIARLKGKSFVPTRTLQYRRQRAGVKQVVQQAQLEKIAALATQRNWSAQTLVNFCKRQCGHHPLRTTEDANKVTEALKSMNKREGLWAA